MQVIHTPYMHTPSLASTAYSECPDYVLLAGVACYSIPLKMVRGDQLIVPPDHNMPFEIIPLKLKVDTKHRLLMLNTCNVDEYFQNPPADLRHIGLS